MSLNIKKYDMKGKSEVKYISATARDFYVIFGLGNDKGIAAKNATNIVLLCIKELKKENEVLKQRVETLERMALAKEVQQ